MSSVGAVVSSRLARHDLRASTPEPDSRGPELPDPDVAALCGMRNSLTVLYELLARQNRVDTRAGAADVGTHVSRRDVAASEREEATRKSIDASDHGHAGFFEEIGHFFETLFTDLLTFRVDKIPIDTAEHFRSVAENPRFWRELAEAASTVVKWVGRAVSAIGSVALIAAGAVSSQFGVGVGLVTLGALSLSATASGALIQEAKLGGKDGAAIGLGLEIGGAVASFTGVSVGAQLAAQGGQAALHAFRAVDAAGSGVRLGAAVSGGAAAAAKVGTTVFEHAASAAETAGVRADGRVRHETGRISEALSDVAALVDSNRRAREILIRVMNETSRSESGATVMEGWRV